MLVVTGPTGNVGADLTQSLADLGDSAPPYRIAAHHPEKVLEAYGAHVPVVPFEYDDRSTWPAVLDGASALFLLFPLPHPKTARSRMEPFVAAAAEAGVGHVIYVTVPAADTNRRIPHHVTEQAILRSGMAHTFLRCSYFSQNLVRQISTHGVDIAEHDELFIPAKKSRTTFLDSRDVADAVLRILEDPEPHLNQSYKLCGSETLTFGDVAEILTAVLGRPIRYTHPSMPRFWLRLKKRGVSWDTIVFMTIVYTLARTGRNVVECDDLERILGRAPRTFEEFAKDYRWRWETRTWT